MIFIGRKKELRQLSELKAPALVAVKGRRRIGKSRLVHEFAQSKRFFAFAGLPPIDKITAHDQREHFAYQLMQNFKTPPITFNNWSNAFENLEVYLNEPTVILFDEISWMGSKDPTFIPKLKVWWDIITQKKLPVILVLCGSVSTWVEKNILKSTAFFGRISLEITLDELSIAESIQLLKAKGIKGSDYDLYKILAVVGGVPWYLEAFSENYLAEENIKKLCFTKDGKFVNEFDRIFHDLFNGHGAIYKKIVHLLADGMRDLSTIRNELNYAHSGSLSEHLQALIISGFVSQHQQWSLKTGRLSNKSLYRLCDNYVRFFIKYIEPNFSKIQKNTFDEVSLFKMPGWESMMGFQVENLLLRNRTLLLESLDIDPANVLADNPYFQQKTTRQKGCQIDYLIQTYTKNLFVCEFKFRRKELGTEIIDEIAEKIERFSKPRNYGVIPVLFHLGGVSNAVYDAQYFYRIVDISEFLSS